ncbi:hypothetical protein CHELA41_21433 [Hyphomicrobiales bacterium]|nr:hypothetical protein CHELA41_21433 [Hyphomicrobiales bacterium]
MSSIILVAAAMNAVQTPVNGSLNSYKTKDNTQEDL